MKSVIIVCLLAFGMNAATMAQCPINEILTMKDLQNIASTIETNTDCIKTALTTNPEYAQYKTYLDYLYNTSAAWVYHTNPDKEKLFADFYSKWGKEYPTMKSPAPTSEAFYVALKQMIATDPEFFAQVKETKIPLKYKQWLFVQDMDKRYGATTVLNAENAISKVANLQTLPAYALISH